ncbi:cilia- and flagella-associated protein 100-like [Watersipora subatra]|uniref:cilia- and flagella-associated protein 100-like n=1 Tax=Watersipora subatra TaxID=2589382 RepID=UPI00355AF3E5
MSLMRSNAGSPAGSNMTGKDSQLSHRSGAISFPNSAGPTAKNRMITDSDDGNDPNVNPFKMPLDNDIFQRRDQERLRKKQLREKQKSMKVHEKMTYAAKVNHKTRAMIRPADSDDEQQAIVEAPAGEKAAVAVKEDPQFVIAVTRDGHVEKESLAEYINKKREMFLVQYSLGVKRDEMRKLEEIAQAEEKKLELAEQYLEEDAAMFDEFLRENDKNSVDAIQVAEAETKAKLDKVAEIKKITTQMMGIKSEISKYEELLKEYQLYKKFLDDVSPEEVRQERAKKKAEKIAERRKKRLEEASSARDQAALTSASSRAKSRTRNKKGAKEDGQGKEAAQTPTTEPENLSDVEDAVEEPDLWFTDPQQLLDIFGELEEQNLSLIQNSQETEEALEEMRQTIKVTQIKMEKETAILKEQIDKLNTAIYKEEAKANELEMKAKMFSFGEFKQEDQDQMLAALNRKVAEVYGACIGQNEANISTLQMLTNIENRLEELFEQIEMMPADKVEAAEKAKEKERRLKAREEKMEQQRLHQEERVRRALERAKAEPKRKMGKKLVFRSEPPAIKKKDESGADKASREEEELAYFFT